jgi:4-diphosphocytidyl-2-C-methyl-D-erythritol kinase
MVPVNLYDDLEIRPAPSGINLSCHGHRLPRNEDNLAYRAAELFFAQTGLPTGVSIKLSKHIPVAAGLGGGSSDAAAVLATLNVMHSSLLESETLQKLAGTLGADVPFFLQSRPCVATGIGDVLQPLEKWPKLWYVIVAPRLHISTARVYAGLGRQPANSEAQRAAELKLTKEEHKIIIDFFREVPLAFPAFFENDLEAVTVTHYPIIEDIKSSLIAAGAAGALMSGSGPSVFGVFDSSARASAAVDALSRQEMGKIFLVH